MSMREKDQADFDLERFMGMFDEAMTSTDPRVIDALRSLMMIVTLTRPEGQTEHSRFGGPLRRLFDDMHNLNRSVSRLQEEIHGLRYREHKDTDVDKFYIKAQASQIAQRMDDEILQKLAHKNNSPGLLQPTKGLLKK